MLINTLIIDVLASISIFLSLEKEDEALLEFKSFANNPIFLTQ
jgi:hypothetical protein